jgi:hypothetical protein
MAKRFHPDLAESVDEVAERTHVMQKATEAFHRRDIEALRRLAETQEPASVLAGRSLAERSVWAIR